ncbi:MAG: hypothetical protein ABI610_11560 [Acidobacteriota bacterium]
METDRNRDEKCANPGCGRIAAREDPYCENCELERMLYRRDLRRAGAEKGSPAVESR